MAAATVQGHRWPLVSYYCMRTLVSAGFAALSLVLFSQSLSVALDNLIPFGYVYSLAFVPCVSLAT
jgi:hypothetical protein